MAPLTSDPHAGAGVPTDRGRRSTGIARGAAFAVITAAALLCAVGCAGQPVPGSSASGDAPGAAESRLTSGSLTLTPGDGFTGTGAFDPENTCDGRGDLSPGLRFSGVPERTAELAVSMVDLDNGMVHWLQVAIPRAADGLVQHQLIDGAREIRNDLGEATYDGPCPPSGSTHHYALTLYALTAPFADPGGSAAPGAVLDALRTQAAASSSFTATYTRG